MLTPRLTCSSAKNAHQASSIKVPFVWNECATAKSAGFSRSIMSERVAVELDRQDHWLAGMPDDRQAVADPARGEHLGKKIKQGLRSDDRFRVTIRKIAISAIDIAERGRLDDQQLYAGHEAARRATPIDRLTNYATNCSNCSNCANCSNWATPNGRSPPPVVPPVAPGEPDVVLVRMRRLTLCLGYLGDHRSNSRQPLGDPGLARRRGLEARRDESRRRSAPLSRARARRRPPRRGGSRTRSDDISAAATSDPPFIDRPHLTRASITKRGQRGQTCPTLSGTAARSYPWRRAVEDPGEHRAIRFVCAGQVAYALQKFADDLSAGKAKCSAEELCPCFLRARMMGLQPKGE